MNICFILFWWDKYVILYFDIIKQLWNTISSNLLQISGNTDGQATPLDRILSWFQEYCNMCRLQVEELKQNEY